MLGHPQQNFGQPEAAPSFNRVAARRHPLVAEVRRRLEQHLDRPIRGRVVLGVSGGSDSVSLALAMDAVAATLSPGQASIEPIIAHVHHHLRPDADDDASFVCELGRRLEMPVHLLDVFPGDRPGNVASNARDDRYQALEQLARTVHADAVLVAHHAEDQLETLLMHLGRGCSIAGLAAMPWVGPMPGAAVDATTAPDVRLVRPMLGIEKNLCVSMCTAAGLPWREDATNQDHASARARVRHDVMPILESLWPGVARRIHHLTDTLAEARASFERDVDAAFGATNERNWSRSDLRRLPATLISAGLRRAALDARPDIADDLDASMLEQAALMVGDDERRPRSLDWPRGLRLSIDRSAVRLSDD